MQLDGFSTRLTIGITNLATLIELKSTPAVNEAQKFISFNINLHSESGDHFNAVYFKRRSNRILPSCLGLHI